MVAQASANLNTPDPGRCSGQVLVRRPCPRLPWATVVLLLLLALSTAPVATQGCVDNDADGVCLPPDNVRTRSRDPAAHGPPPWDPVTPPSLSEGLSPPFLSPPSLSESARARGLQFSLPPPHHTHWHDSDHSSHCFGDGDAACCDFAVSAGVKRWSSGWRS
jgi:hypothetical protein